MEEMFGLIGDIGRHHNAINLLNGDLKKRLEKAVNDDAGNAGSGENDDLVDDPNCTCEPSEDDYLMDDYLTDETRKCL